MDKTIKNFNEKPLISIIVPVYNVEKYIKRCIESILNQTYGNLELILVDDGSKDSSLNICEEYKQKDHRVLVVSQTNAGSSVARNTGLKLAKGEYIGFVDSDDWIKINMLEKMIVKAIKSNVLVVECANTTSRENDKKKTIDTPSYQIENQEESLERIILADRFAVWRRIYHKDILAGKTFIPGKIHQDVFYTLDVVKNIEKLGYLNEKLYVYNVENESVIRSAYSLQKLDAKDAVYYVRDTAANYSSRLKELGNIYLTKGLINHYIPLFSHEYLDSDFQYRKQLKNEIRNHFINKRLPWNIEKIRAIIAIYSPFWLYKRLLQLNRYRIKIKKKFLKLDNV